MRKYLLILLGLSAQVVSAQQNPWENPALYQENKEAPHVTFMLFDQPEKVIKDDYSLSPFYKSLNGEWKFIYVDKLADRNQDFYKTDLDDSQWSNIQVPSNWEIQGFGIPLYTNITYEFPKNPPFVGPNDPVGTYRRHFNIPENWDGKEIMLQFGSITGAAFVTVNGHQVGISKASKTPAEFDITKYIKKGDNLLAVQVFRWHDGSYLEDQDFWRLSGIERDVMLYALPKFSIWDFNVDASLDNTYKNGLLNLAVNLRKFKGADLTHGKLKVAIQDSLGHQVFTKTLNVKDATDTLQWLSIKGEIKNVQAWNGEHPYLYDMIISFTNDGKTIYTGSKIGFRKVEIKDSQLMVNGVPLIVHGTDRHEHDPKTGHVISKELMLKDIQMMKAYNINAVRNSHYPNNPLWYKLCDKYGIYLVDEANVEIHGMGATYQAPFDKSVHPAYLPLWAPAIADRIHRLVKTDRNHPSVIIWSMGNECANGQVFHDAYHWIKKEDPTRPVQFEQAGEEENTDIVCPMYPSISYMKAYAAASSKTRPYIMCEYSHAMGNSNGNFQEYWDIINSSKKMQGGFIWDWVDQGLETKAPDGKIFYAYGGDLGGFELQNDENFCANGLVSANRIPHPGLNEVKKVYQNIIFSDFDQEKNEVKIANRFAFSKLDNEVFKWQLFKNGDLVAEKTFSVDLGPRSSKTIHLDLPKITSQPGEEYTLNLYAYLKNAEPLIPAGHEVAREQFLLNSQYFQKQAQVPGDLKVTQNQKSLKFTSGDVEGSFNIQNGSWTSYRSNKNHFQLNSFPEPYFWRAPTDNDFGNGMPYKLGIWRNADENKVVKKVTVGQQNVDGVHIKVDYLLTGIDVPYTLDYQIKNDGAVEVTASIDMTGRDLPELPRFGMRMQMPEEYDQISYYGRGPWENYTDRKTAAFIGKYEQKVEDQYANTYIRPQESGNKTDVRWFELTNSSGEGIKVIGEQQPICFSAINHSTEDLDPGLTKKQQHPTDLKPRKEVYLHIDLKQRGVGGDNSWGAYPHQQYLLLDKKYTYSYTISLIGK